MKQAKIIEIKVDISEIKIGFISLFSFDLE